MRDREEQTDRIWSIPSQYDQIEKDSNKGKSKTTIIICSIILLGVTAALTTWVFVVRPNFYPQLKIMSRDEKKMTDSIHHVQRRSGLFEGEGEFIDSEAEVRSSIKKKKTGRNSKPQKTKQKSIVKQIFTKVNEKETPYHSSRLPRDILPTDYYINLDVDLEKDSYTGVVAIDLKCTKETQYFIFHSRKLRIKDVVFASAMNTDHMKIKKILWFAKNEMYIVEMKEKFQKGKEYAVKIEFEAEFNQHLAGLYKSQYRGTDGKFRTVATSHFEPTDARTAFPCLDEPNFKAKFHIKIIHSAEYIALSNMPIEDTRDVGNGRVEDSFQVSVSMSTYLVAFAIVDFKFKEAKTDSGIKVRVYAPEGDYNRIDHALEAGTIVLSFYEKFFGAPYPLPKLDLLAVPDFLAGAMEDWGLVSFRSSYLIYDKDFVTLDQKKMVTLVIAHELAHQWFGNLVTMKWWNDIWLNEGFANYVEMLGTNEVDDQFHSLDLQVPTGWQAALSLDSLKNSHPIDQEVDTPSEIDELFDAISYNKGAALLRMLKSFLGNDFIKGVKDYIQTHKFTNAETDDLWRHLKKADHTHQLEIKSIMDTWSRQSGYPVLTVTRDGEDLVISQKSFLLAKAESAKKSKKNKGIKKGEDEDDKLPEDLHWHVPFTFFFDNDPETIKSVWLNNETLVKDPLLTMILCAPIEKQDNGDLGQKGLSDNTIVALGATKDHGVRVKAQKDFKWVKGNADNQGYYIVNYDEATWKNIIKQLQKDHEVFSPVDRAGLIHDAFKLGCDGIIDPLIPLNLAKYLKKEKEYIPWAMARSKLDCITILISDKKIKRLYKKYFWYLMSHLVDASMLSVGKFNVKQPLDVFQRFDTFSFVMKYGFRKDFKKKLEDLFQDLKDDKKIPGLSAELRALAIIFGFDPKDDDDFKYLWKTYVETPLDSDRRFIMKAFSRVKDKKKLQIILDSSLDLKKVRAQDTIPLMMTLVRIGGRNQVWNFIEKNFDKLTKRYGGQYQLGSLVTEVAGGFYKKKDYEQVKKFLTKHSLGKKGSRTERQVLEKMKNNMDKHISSVSDKKSDKIESWVKKEIKKVESKIKMNW